MKAAPHIGESVTGCDLYCKQQFGGPVLAIGYIGLLLLLYQLPLFRTVFRLFQKRTDVVDNVYYAIDCCDTYFLRLRFRHVWQSRLGNGSMDCSRCVRHPSYICRTLAVEIPHGSIRMVMAKRNIRKEFDEKRGKGSTFVVVIRIRDFTNEGMG